jgi:hypothetical protein
MPDDLIKNDPQSVTHTTTTAVESEQPSQLEQLMAEAEVATAVPVTDHPKPCQHIQVMSNQVYKKCPTCLWHFCDDCASTLDPQYCHLCLTEPDVRFEQKPLVDEDGVTHEGRELVVDPSARFFQPRFGTLCKTISDMREAELEEYIQYYRNLVKQAETALDFRRVVLGSAQLELSQRQDAARRKLRTDKTKYPIKTVTVAKDGTGKKTVKASLADMAKMLEMLKQLQKNREAKK